MGRIGGRRDFRPGPRLLHGGGQGRRRRPGHGAIIGLLGSIPLFSGVDRSNLKLRGFTSERIYFEPGQTDFRQGEAGDKAWIVADGAADVFPTLLEENRVIAVHVTRAVAGRLGTTLRDYGRVATMS